MGEGNSVDSLFAMLLLTLLKDGHFKRSSVYDFIVVVGDKIQCVEIILLTQRFRSSR